MLRKRSELPDDLEFFSIFDSKSKSYDDPMYAPNKDVLLRDILNIFRNPEQSRKNKFFINAEDYSLFKIGSYSKKTGQLKIQNLEHVANFHDLKALVEPDQGIVTT